MTEQRDFKGVWIDKNIWLDRRLNALEKVILTEIDSLSSEEKGCYASNQYLAEFCQCSETKISLGIKKLIELGYIYQESFDGRARVLKSRLSNFERQTHKNCNADSQKMKDNNIDNNKDNNKEYNIYSTSDGGCVKNNEGMSKNTHQINNILNNNNSTKLNIKENIEKKKFVPPTLEEVEAYIKERGCNVDANLFYDYYTEGDWIDAKGLKVRNWKQKLITWEKKEGSSNVAKQPAKKGDGSAYRNLC